MPASSDVPNGGSGGGTTPHNSKSPPSIISLPPSPPALTPQHRRTCRRRATIAVVTICLLLTAVIVLQIVIVGLILNSRLVQNATGVPPFVRSQTFNEGVVIDGGANGPCRVDTLLSLERLWNDYLA
ncbi:hypothetical protein EGR_04371 [Echinococcus granulosus]|uniref:Uncharacterized protein n=1 Tax=Echinococcus granulosus TaxID=6210 RepID=W6UGT9_ECHGR|nr:hypothetical protein EGR_04371 [Echinococcus granulosus]EUB60745.1 hypothetical protein EGR_04371 [Echinococcus granulosus]